MAGEDCANPLLLGWIKEWLDQARERNSKGVTVYKKAYDSMKACPLVFNHPSEAQQLSGLGPKLCDRLTEELRKYCTEHGLPMPELPYRANKRATKETDKPEERSPKKAKKTKPYVPTLRSGPYALLTGLSTLDEDSRSGLTKSELIELAQPHCDSSFTAPPDPTKFYTAWNSMKTLIQKDFVHEHGRPTRRYLLTEEGWEIAKRMRSTNVVDKSGQGRTLGSPQPDTVRSRDMNPQRHRVQSTTSSRTRHSNTRDESLNPSEHLDLTGDSPEPAKGAGAFRPRRTDPTASIPDNSNYAALSASCRPIALPPGSFTIELVLDVREIRTTKDRDYISNELIRRGITPIVRSLELGDSLWVAKCKDPSLLSSYGEEGDEVMLDWILERKRLDDLIGSIKDGRFHEQKFRLRRSGVKNVIYLIEEFAVADSTSSGPRFQEAVASAIASTQVVDGYFVKKTRNLDDSIRYLARMTEMLRDMYTRSSTISPRPQKGISIIPTKSIDSLQTYLQLLRRFRADDDPPVPSTTANTYTTTFSTFSALSSKSEMLSLRDVFLKMLMCTRGVTGDKALEIQRRWRTPREFVEAFEGLDKENGNRRRVAAEDMVSSQLSGLVGRKKIGKVLSKRIAEVWGPQG